MKPKGFPDASCLGTAKIPIYALVQKVKVTARLSVVRFERLPSLNPKAVSMVQSAAVLLVDDSIGDVELAREVWRESAVPTQLYVTSNGEEAIRFLRRQGPYAHMPVPQLVLLDLNLPFRSGLDVLREIKQDHTLRPIPVVVFSTSSTPLDIARAYDNFANGYVVKPMELSAYIEVLTKVQSFWLGANIAPEQKVI
ncbi:MAG: response regulator [Ardenticatenaceae bacterium]|nr:response regulator [Ardenticatenaceae bacterium]